MKRELLRGSFITQKLSRCQASENRIVIRVFIKQWEKEMRKVVKWNWSEFSLEWGTKDLKLKSSGEASLLEKLSCFKLNEEIVKIFSIQEANEKLFLEKIPILNWGT